MIDGAKIKRIHIKIGQFWFVNRKKTQIITILSHIYDKSPLNRGLLCCLDVEIGILEAKEIENAVETEGIDALVCTGNHTRLGVEGNAKTSQ